MAQAMLQVVHCRAAWKESKTRAGRGHPPFETARAGARCGSWPVIYLDILLKGWKAPQLFHGQCTAPRCAHRIAYPAGADGHFTTTSSTIRDRAILRFEAPLGSFFLREEPTKPIIFIVGGTGFAPTKSVIEHAFPYPHGSETVLLGMPHAGRLVHARAPCSMGQRESQLLLSFQCCPIPKPTIIGKTERFRAPGGAGRFRVAGRLPGVCLRCATDDRCDTRDLWCARIADDEFLPIHFTFRATSGAHTVNPPRRAS